MNTPQLSPTVLVNAGRYRTLLEINNAIITNLTQESLLNAICEALQHVLPVYRAAINLYEPETDTLRMLALSSWKTPTVSPRSSIA
jgi:GAF domain-containing protein